MDSANASAGDLTRNLFQLFPHGIMLLDSERRVLIVNDACRTMLGAMVAEGADVTCCELFGCGNPNGPLAHGCLSELALEARGPLPDTRIDLAPGAPVGAVWLTAAPYQNGAAEVIVELRPGDRRDRRRRVSPLWEPPTRLEVFTLGRTLIYSPEGPISGPWLHQRPGEVLKFLITERKRVVTAEEIAEALWPGGEQRAVSNVRYFIYALRARLEPNRGRRAPSKFILAEHGGYRLNPETVRIDVDEFDRLVTAGLERLERKESEAAEQLLRDALRLYGGEFLAEERYALWAFAERDRLRDLAGAALSAMGDLRRRASDPAGAAVYIERLADMHPFDSDLHREAIALAVALGRHTVARRRYTTLRRRLMQEFGHGPSFDLSDVTTNRQEPPSSAAKPRA